MRYVLKLKQKVGKLYIFCSVTYLHVVPNISDTYNGGSAIITPEWNGALKRSALKLCLLSAVCPCYCTVHWNKLLFKLNLDTSSTSQPPSTSSLAKTTPPSNTRPHGLNPFLF